MGDAIRTGLVGIAISKSYQISYYNDFSFPSGSCTNGVQYPFPLDALVYVDLYYACTPKMPVAQSTAEQYCDCGSTNNCHFAIFYRK